MSATIPYLFRAHLDEKNLSQIKRLHDHYADEVWRAWPYRDRALPREMIHTCATRVRQIRAYVRDREF